jgi:sporulation protein YlmC with PRC-barrel domain
MKTRMNESKPSQRIRLALLSAVALSLSTTAFAQTNANTTPTSPANATQADTAPSADYRPLRASKLIGMKVQNPQGQDLGKISDMIVNMNTGDVRYAVLEFDPGIFEGEKLFAVPTSQLRMAADRDTISYDMSKDKLENAAVPRGDWNAAWRDPDYLPNLDKIWGITQPSRGALAHRVSDLIGKDVNNLEGKKIGEIEELVVNMATQNIHYAVLEFDPSLASSEQKFAFPLRAFDLTQDRDRLVLDVDKTRLQAMKSFTDSRYSSLNDRTWVADIDRYFVTIATSTADKRVAELFVKLDDDKDGSLSAAEAKDSADLDRDWARFDKNNDGRIDRQEFISQYTIERGTEDMKNEKSE